MFEVKYTPPNSLQVFLMLHLKLGAYVTERYQEEGMAYLPDFEIYDLHEGEYQTFWNKIRKHPQNRLYTDGVQVYRASWLQSFFQSFKGWLGFDNHCQTNKVELTLAKIAYHGYLRGFRSVDFDNYSPTLISERFKTLINSTRDNKKSAELQKVMMTYYLTYSAHFPELYQPIRQAYPFGRTLIREELYQLLPAIDPQDPQIISQAINGMHHRSESASSTDYFKGSSFSEAYADYLVEQRQYDEAQNWSQQVKSRFKEHFIKFYLSQKDIDPAAVNKAIELIAALAESANEAEQKKAIDYIKQNFSHSEQYVYLNSYPELRNKVAKAYLNEAITERSRNRLVKALLGNKVIPLLAHAVRLNPNALSQDTSMQDVILREDWTTYLFNEAITEKRFTDAGGVYEKHPLFKFDKTNLGILRDHYFAELTNKTAAINAALVDRNTTLAEQIALERIEIAKTIARITPQDNPMVTVTKDYAETLLNIDEKEHPNVKDANLNRLNKAQELLKNAGLLNNSPMLKTVVNKLLLRKIDHLMEQIKVPITFDSDWRLRDKFVSEHQIEIDALRNNLNTYIALNEKNKSKEARPILAKVYYFLGDVIAYILRTKEEAVPYFKKASEVMPENLYYLLRYYQVADDERRDTVREKIEALGDFHGTKYDMWMEERWYDDKCMSAGMDIHNVPSQDQGIIASFGRFLS